MSKKSRIIAMAVAFVLCIPGCAGGNNEAIQKDSVETEAAVQAETVVFPESYTYQSDKVKFECSLELPEEIKGQPVQEVTVKGKIYTNREKTYAAFVEGKEIKEEHTIPEMDTLPEDDIYTLTDAYVSIGPECIYASNNFSYYSQLGLWDDMQSYADDKVSFGAPEACVTDLEKLLSDFGYPAEDFSFSFKPASAQTMKRVEQDLVEQEYIQGNKQKAEWTEEDDVYIIYSYQHCEGIPVFHEYMNLGQQLAYDTPSGAPVHAIYSSRGLENLYVSVVYEFEKTGKTLELKSFDEIAKVLQVKFESLLNERTYLVNRAKLYMRVYFDENQNYVAEPVWYFEIIDDEAANSVVLVNAVTGKEIYLR